MKAQTIAAITIETAKGKTIETRWRLYRRRPYPSPDRHGRWEGAGELIARYNGPATGKLPNEYVVALLRSDFDPATATGNRDDYAGFSTGYGDQRTTNPGTIIYRGRDLGELCGTLRMDGSTPYMRWDDTHPDGVRAWLSAAVVPQLVAAITANHAALTREALDTLRVDMAARVAYIRKQADELEAAAAEAMKLAERVNA